ncbi:Flp family type IVb pilin [Pseudomonas knackmussii]|uniref:Flp family type IVb pilin n=1 Tax=Pseudomonas knackmussii TaxID=65741 RepID=UPI003BD3DF24
MNFKDFSLNVYSKVKAFAQDQEGATAIEYAVIAGLIVVAIVGTLQVLGPQLNGIFEQISAALP